MSSDFSSQNSKAAKFPDKGPSVAWGPVSSIVVAALAYLGAQFLAAILIGFFVSLTSLSEAASEAWLRSVSGQFLFVLMSDTFIVLGLWFFLRSRHANIRQLGFGRRPVWTDLGIALAGYGVYFVLLIVVGLVVGSLTQIDLDQKQELGFDNLLDPAQRVMALVSLVVLAPIVEEVIFRGFMFAGLRKKMKFIWAALVTSLLFAGPHLLASSEGLLWVAGIDTLILSLILCYLRERTGALWAPIAVHAIKNSVAFAFLLLGVATL